MVDLNDAFDQMDMTDMFRIFHSKEANYTFFSNAHGTFSKIDYMIGHVVLNKPKQIQEN